MYLIKGIWGAFTEHVVFLLVEAADIDALHLVPGARDEDLHHPDPARQRACHAASGLLTTRFTDRSVWY
jgi:hypothetical protein